MSDMRSGQDVAEISVETGASRSAPRRIFDSIFGRHSLNTAVLVFLAATVTGAIHPSQQVLADPDLWWHLADARMMFATHHFIHTAWFSFTVAGKSWIDPEWLSEIPYWLGYSWGRLRGIELIAFAAFCANLLFIYFRSYWKSRHYSAALLTSVLGLFLIVVNSGPRTVVFAYLALGAEMAILEAAERGKPKLLWLLPPLFCVWINLHGSFIAGLVLLGLYVACGAVKLKVGVFDQEAFSRSDRNRLLLVLLASIAALMVNPYGWRLIWNPFDMEFHQRLNMAATVEWQPLNLGTPLGLEVLTFIVLMIVANCLRGRKWKLYELVFILLAWYSAFAHQRFTFFACVITAPWLADDVARSFLGVPNRKTVPILNAAITLAIAAGLIYFFPSEATLEKNLAAEPLAAIAAIQPSWRTFNNHELGGLMEFHSKPTFVDSRNDIYEHHGILRDYFEIIYLRAPFAMFRRYHIDHVLIHAGTPLSYLLEHTPNWRVVMREGAGDDRFVLFAKTEGTNVFAHKSPLPAARQGEGEPKRR